VQYIKVVTHVLKLAIRSSCQNIQLKLMYQGHWVKGTVTGANNFFLGITYQLVSGSMMYC